MKSEERNSFFKVVYAQKLEAALIQLGKEKTDVVLLDFSNSEGRFLEFFLQVHDKVPVLPIIVIVDISKETCAFEFIRNGAQECLVKEQLHGKMLVRVIRYAIERKEVEERLKAHAQQLAHELERTLKELREKEDEMVRREKVLATGELAAAVAHEIRNPLSVISMSVQYLQSKFDLKDPAREFSEAIIRKVQKLDSVTKRLISYGWQGDLHLVRRNLNRHLKRILSLMKVQCKSQGIQIVQHYGSRVHPVEMDEEMMEEVFTNLLTNAIEAMPSGGELTVETDFDAAQEQVVIAVRDTGRGVPPAIREYLFKPFFSTKRKNGGTGTGLGLAIVHRIVTLHGGKIDVESRISGPSKGTTFTLRLPVSRE
jgi:signal transduction histidine kinase